MKSIKNYIIVLLSLLFGLFIYLGFRNTSNPFYTALKALGFSQYIDQWRNDIVDLNLPFWIIYSLPDGLWMFAFVLFIFTVWDCNLNKESRIWVYGSISGGLAFEIIQIGDFGLGVFDWLDLLVMIISSLLVLWIFNETKSKNYSESNQLYHEH